MLFRMLYVCIVVSLSFSFFFFFFFFSSRRRHTRSVSAFLLNRSSDLVLVIRLRSLRLLRVSGIVMRLRMFLLLITFLKASHSFRNRLLVICKNAYLFATMIMTSVSSPFSCCSGHNHGGSAGMPRPISYAVFCLKKKTIDTKQQ